MIYALSWAFLFFLQIFCSKIWIARLHQWRVVQIQKSYGLQSHIETKSSTPSMGGVVFLLIGIASLLPEAVFSETRLSNAALFWILPLGSASIGFIDDWIKLTRKSSEGFPSLYKLAAQILLTVPWSYWIVFSQGLSLWPGVVVPALLAVPLLTIVSIGMLNAVNVTDGLDGLAAGAALFSFIGAIVLLPLESFLLYPALAGSALCAGFLWHNAHPAKVFMGDIGSHFLAGMLVALCAHSEYFIAVIPLGFLFGVEIVSVAMQLIAIHCFKRKVFRMSPLHHHFELLGWSETQIVTRFWIIHGAGLAFLALFVQGILWKAV